MTDQIAQPARTQAQPGRVPRLVPLFNPIARFLLAAGVPLGFNGLLTVRGRKSGLPRTTPVAIIEVSGRRWVWCPWGDVHWVRNLRAAGQATTTMRGRRAEVLATELDPDERVVFFRDTLRPLVRQIPLGRWFIRVADGVDVDDPVAAAYGRRVFELHPIDSEPVAAAGETPSPKE
jgi:deazaflavin-dependent oxidoreductase (nitroreductase family)